MNFSTYFRNIGIKSYPMKYLIYTINCSLLLILFVQSVYANDSQDLNQDKIDALIAEKKVPIKQIKDMGPKVLPYLVITYKNAIDNLTKAKVAWVFYQLSWRSEEAKAIMLEDIHISDRVLRLQVQWALGRVSDDYVIVQSLVDNMRNDPNPLFRDKAACALASDQIFQAPRQRYLMLKEIIDALEDDNEQVRKIANKALEVNTGQNKGYQYNADLGQRQRAIERWIVWLEEFHENL